MTTERSIEVLDKLIRGSVATLHSRSGIEALEMAIKALERQKWIPVSERLPDERDSMFAKFKGTQKWTSGMFEKISDNVNVTIEFEDGKKATTTSHTTDGKWRCEKEYGLKTKVIAWQPLPEPYKGDE